MKKVIIIVLLVTVNANSQMHLMFKAKDLQQRDSISNDLVLKGYKEYLGFSDALFVHLQDDSYCFNNSLMGYKEVTLQEFYINVKSNLNLDETTKQSIKSLEDYLSNTDKFSGEKTYYGGGNTVSFMKVTGKNSSSQYVSIKIPGITLNYGCYGVNILFENGKKIIRSNEKVETDYDSEGWAYKAFFTPNLNEITLLKTQKIIAVKLYIYEANIDDSESEIVMEDAKILLSTPKPKKKK